MAMKSLQKKLRANANLEGMTASGFQHGHVVRDKMIGAVADQKLTRRWLCPNCRSYNRFNERRAHRPPTFRRSSLQAIRDPLIYLLVCFCFT